MQNSEVPNEDKNKDFFPFGSMYAPVARGTEVPMSEWEGDVARMKELGFTIIRAWASWDRIEQKEGERDFTTLDHIFSLADKYGMKITLYIGGAFHSLTGCYPPSWLWGKGTPQTEIERGNENGMNICLDDPLYREKNEDFLAELVHRYAEREALHSWIVWGEPAWRGCRCPHTLANFRNWLSQKYSDISEMNRAWSTEMPVNYENWEAVNPIFSSYGSSLDWQEFCEDNMDNAIRWIHNIVRKYSSSGKPTLTYPCPWDLDARATTHFNNIWKMGKSVDILGMSHYVLQYKDNGKSPYIPACYLDRVRSAAPDGNFWIMENPAGSVLWNFQEPFSIAPRRNFMLNAQMLAHGANGILSWLFRTRIGDRQAGEFGLLGRDGSLTERALTTSELALFIKRNAALFSKSRYTASAAILNAQSTFRLTAVEKCDSLEGNKYFQNSWIGAYRLMWDLQTQADFIDDDEVLEGKLEDYKILLIPFRLNMSDEIAKRIEEFVASGGLAIAEFPLGMKDDRGFTYAESPGCGLDKVFGFSSVDAEPIFEDKKIVFKEGESFSANTFIQQMTVKNSGEPAAEFPSGAPAAVRNKYKKGNTVTVASMFFAEYEKSGDSTILGLMDKWMKEHGLSNEIKVNLRNGDKASLAGVEVSRLKASDGRDMFFILNYSEKDVVLDCLLSSELTGKGNTLKELVTETEIKGEDSEKGKKFELALNKESFAVLLPE